MLSIFVTSHIGSAELDRFPQVKFIATRSTGFDHIDLAECAKRGIIVANVPSYGENTVAEQAFALILCLSRKIYESYKQIEQGGKFSPDGLKGFDLKGKTIGIVGLGRIGVHTARIAKGFEMNILAFDQHQNEQAIKDYGVKYVTLDELLAGSDIISLHAPYMKETHHLINLDNIGKIKKGAYLINTARGGLVDTAAIIKGLQDGILVGAGLDVLEEENFMIDELSLLNNPHPNESSLKTILENHYLIDHPRVIITPHNAFNTQEAIERIIGTTVEDIKGFTAGAVVNMVKVS
ncbi:MAG: hydroxyacid dehydrogenase [Candidatus Vogelbacteria bacterium]|nr:hydroxyacid dehydrogenase [Candidatus Vogelbacteria bacterium]